MSSNWSRRLLTVRHRPLSEKMRSFKIITKVSRARCIKIRASADVACQSMYHDATSKISTEQRHLTGGKALSLVYLARWWQYNPQYINPSVNLIPTFVLQAALPVGLVLSLAVALQALVLQQGFFSLQLPQTRLQALSAAHLKSIIIYFQFVRNGSWEQNWCSAQILSPLGIWMWLTGWDIQPKTVSEKSWVSAKYTFWEITWLGGRKSEVTLSQRGNWVIAPASIKSRAEPRTCANTSRCLCCRFRSSSSFHSDYLTSSSSSLEILSRRLLAALQREKKERCVQDLTVMMTCDERSQPSHKHNTCG